MASRANGGSDQSAQTSLKCCCGRSDCAYLEHNNVALEVLERDLEKAAKLGQALLTRHESYVAESQQENDRLNKKIAALESERTSLQDANEKIVAENRDLLTKLDAINKTYTDSDTTVKKLEALLKDTDLEVRRLNALARRAEELEAQVHDMERERTDLTQHLKDSEQEGRSALSRWRESEKRLRRLEIELEKIEWEAKREMERHEEVVARLERERVLERELGGAEGRLKGAAALQGIQAGTNDNVVSHFVRDILQDNANLQAGIVELRELLQTSNEEVQNLRQQIMQHRPVDDTEEHDHAASPLPLDQQMAWDQPSPSEVQREVHVHHHYHAKLAAKSARSPTVRKRAQRRTMMPGSISTPDSSVPSTPVARPKRYASSPVAPLALHHPQPKKNRWSVQSATTMSSNFSSLPSSPRSYFDRYSSIFDRMDPGEESSRPTSPDSVSAVSSPMQSAVSKGSANPFQPVIEDELESSRLDRATPPVGIAVDQSTPVTILQHKTSHDLTPKPSQMLTPKSTQPINIAPPKETAAMTSVLSSPREEPLAPDTQSVPEHEIPDHDASSPATSSAPEDNGTDTPTRPQTPPQHDASIDEAPPFHASPEAVSIRPTLHRSASHDSLVSISGMDIHIAKRPQQYSPPTFTRSYFTPSRLPTTTLTTTTKQPLTAIAPIAASASQFQTLTSTRGHGEGRRGLEMMARAPPVTSINTISAGSGGTPRRTHSEQSPSPQAPTVAGRLGGWVRSKWGVAPTKSIGDLRSASARQASSASPKSARPPLATLLEAPPISSQPITVSVSVSAGDDGTAVQGEEAAGEQTASAADAVPQHARTASVVTASTSSTGGKRPSVLPGQGVESGGAGSLGAASAMNMMRMPGINQKGSIPGFWLPQRAPSQVEVGSGGKGVDWEGLREGLEGGLG